MSLRIATQVFRTPDDSPGLFDMYTLLRIRMTSLQQRPAAITNIFRRNLGKALKTIPIHKILETVFQAIHTMDIALTTRASYRVFTFASRVLTMSKTHTTTAVR